ncbi:uncharacterized protein LY79DRAFT_579191 [Colletotrichum navitas]|uniref:Uncharacterized protein n=1 Tax=Colletotrichum navitas TaxID=681940 RepID=A0AAD8V6K3_9PEZI|nr:uncharacterized protein LY79DRAFT_579191 [Colletotrichum navitas]KAK1593661.1 hypothetical protein LY79DRAFT_579191 [Colletotrichum navitas]
MSRSEVRRIQGWTCQRSTSGIGGNGRGDRPHKWMPFSGGGVSACATQHTRTVGPPRAWLSISLQRRTTSTVVSGIIQAEGSNIETQDSPKEKQRTNFPDPTQALLSEGPSVKWPKTYYVGLRQGSWEKISMVSSGVVPRLSSLWSLEQEA